MNLRNLFRRKGRTFLTIFGIAVGVAAIITLGALAEGLENGYQAIISGSQADLVLSQPDAFDISYSSIDEKIGVELATMPEVKETSGMLQGFVQGGDIPFFIVYGYPPESFLLQRFQIIDGIGLDSPALLKMHGKNIILGSAAAEVLNKQVGDNFRLVDRLYRIAGIYQTGDALQDSGAVMSLTDAQDLLGKARQVNLFYIQLKDPHMKDRLATRVERRWKELALSSTTDYADRQMMGDILKGYVWGISGLAIVIGGVGMMNAQLMSVIERTREIGVLRAVGWSKARVLWMILVETLLVCLAGGVFGIGLGWLILYFFSDVTSFFGTSALDVSPQLLSQSIATVMTMGIFGGIYPAWRAAHFRPIEALRYEGGSGGRVRRLPFGGMAIQSLWQRTSRTLLTLGAIGLTVGAIMALEGILRGMEVSLTDMALGADAEIMIRQADVPDTSLSAIDERIGEKIEVMPGVRHVSSIVFSAVLLPDSKGFFVILGYSPQEHSIQRFKIVEGEPLSTNHQIILGSVIAKAINKKVGDTIELSGGRFRIVGIYESGIGWEEMGGVLTLRDAQSITGHLHKVTMYGVKVEDPMQASEIVSQINTRFPEVLASLSGEFAEQMPDMKNSKDMLMSISFLAILVGGVAVLNTMLMVVLERTREIGVLRSLGWRRRSILGLILREALLLSLLGGLVGIGLAFTMTFYLNKIPLVAGVLVPLWEYDVFLRAILVALVLGLVGGVYPAFRAAQLPPVEALRYE